MNKVIGIDLGTTNSCVAVVSDGKPVVIANSEGSRTTPSVVALTGQGEWLVGQLAKRQAVSNPAQTVYAVKRLMGRKFDSAEAVTARKSLPYTVAASANNDAWVKLGDRSVSPPELSSHVLRKMKDSAEEFLGHAVSDAIITVPAYFNDSQRQATRDAGRIAGLNVLRIINEPTAAAVAYGFSDRTTRARVAVYDLGGGTFDLSILEVGGGVIEVRCTSGDTYLGGEDFDERIIGWLNEEFKRVHGVDLRQDPGALQRLKEAGEKAKCDLSLMPQAQIDLPFIASDAAGPKHLSARLSREQLEQMTADLVERTLATCQNALNDVGLKTADIDSVILVGGQTRMPLIKRRVADFFGKQPSESVNPDEVVAVGAALQGGVLQGEVEEVLLLDVTPLSLGVETAGGIFTTIIERNTSIPCTASQVFSTSIDNQNMVSIHVLQGERPLARDNHSLSRFDLLGIPPAPRGVPQIEVAFSIDVNGIVSVTARDLGTGRQSTINVRASGGLDEESIDKMIREATDYYELDRESKALVELKNRANGLIYSTERSLSEYAEFLGQDALGPLQEDLRFCQAAVSNPEVDVLTLQAAISQLEESAYKLADVLYTAMADGEEDAPS